MILMLAIALAIAGNATALDATNEKNEDFVVFLFTQDNTVLVKYLDGPCENASYELVSYKNQSGWIWWDLTMSCPNKRQKYISEALEINNITNELKLVPLAPISGQ